MWIEISLGALALLGFGAAIFMVYKWGDKPWPNGSRSTAKVLPRRDKPVQKAPSRDLLEEVAEKAAMKALEKLLTEKHLEPRQMASLYGMPSFDSKSEIIMDERIIPSSVQMDVEDANVEAQVNESEDRELEGSKSKLAKLFRKKD